MSKEWLADERIFVSAEVEPDRSVAGKRYFSRGGVKFALLELLAKEQMHGYQMMKALEDQSGGLYKPSAGTIYPTLQMLRDQELILSEKQDGKQIFTITEQGKAFLEEERMTQAADKERHSREGRKHEERGHRGHYGHHGHHSHRGHHGHHGHYHRGHHHHDEKHGHSDYRADADENEGEPDARRNKRLTPTGRELIHLIKAAERKAIQDGESAEQFRAIMYQFKSSLTKFVESDEE